MNVICLWGILLSCKHKNIYTQISHRTLFCDPTKRVTIVNFCAAGRHYIFLPRWLINKPGTWRWLRKGLQIPMDGMTDWWTDLLKKKNTVAQWKRVGLNFRLNLLNQGGNSEPNGNVKIFFYINSNCVFSKTSWKNTVAQWKRVGLNFR